MEKLNKEWEEKFLKLCLSKHWAIQLFSFLSSEIYFEVKTRDVTYQPNISNVHEVRTTNIDTRRLRLSLWWCRWCRLHQVGWTQVESSCRDGLELPGSGPGIKQWCGDLPSPRHRYRGCGLWSEWWRWWEVELDPPRPRTMFTTARAVWRTTAGWWRLVLRNCPSSDPHLSSSSRSWSWSQYWRRAVMCARMCRAAVLCWSVPRIVWIRNRYEIATHLQLRLNLPSDTQLQSFQHSV